MANRILIVDDDLDFITLLTKYLKSKGLEVLTAGTAKAGVEAIENLGPDMALIDVKLPDQSGVDLVTAIRSVNSEIPIIMVSGYGEPKLVVKALHAGAMDYIQKPVDNAELMEKITAALEIYRDMSIERELGGDGLIIGRSPQMKQLIRDIGKVAISDAPVLIRGESGTGKSLIAEIIHTHSPRRDKPFVTINCPAIPTNLLESELFGHVRGAFTGAVRDKIGKFELADGGTIFMDEIGELPPELQVKTLRVLQGHEFEKVGGIKTIHVDVRVVAATNRNLDRAIQENRFREDLFYRLNVLPIYISPLRERREDLPLLIGHFFDYFCRKANKRFKRIPDFILEHLVEYDWPGNVRELQNVIERAVVIGKEPMLYPSDFIISRVSQPKAPVDTEEISSLRDLEYRSLMKALEASGGNISKAAKILGVGRDTIYRRLRKYKIDLNRS